MIKLNPFDRLSFPQILSHPWLKETNEDDSDDDEEDKEKDKESELGGGNGGKGGGNNDKSQ